VAREWSEQQRLERLRAPQSAYPDVDVSGLAAGTLAGPASPERPSVPVWEYLEYRAAHPEMSMEAISRARFQVALLGGGTLAMSIAELTAPGPHPPTLAITPKDLIDLYRLIDEAAH
jgi:hypothetical protein